MRPRVVSPEGWEEIERIALERAKLPTDVELARKHRISRRRVQQIMKRVRDSVFLRVCEVSSQP